MFSIEVGAIEDFALRKNQVVAVISEAVWARDFSNSPSGPALIRTASLKPPRPHRQS